MATDKILLDHGGGGMISRDLIMESIVRPMGNTENVILIHSIIRHTITSVATANLPISPICYLPVRGGRFCVVTAGRCRAGLKIIPG